MTIKRSISAGEWGELGNDDQDLYDADGENYRFIGANPKKILSAKQHEKDRANKAKQESSELRSEIDKLKEQLDGANVFAPAATGDSSDAVTAIKQQMEKMQAKMNKQEKDYAKTLQSREQHLKDALLQNTIKDIAGQAFTDTYVGGLVLEKRLAVDIVDGQPKVRIRDREGDFNDTLTTQDLIKDLKSDDRHAAYTTSGVKASGVGPNDPFALPPSSSDKTGSDMFGGKDPHEMSNQEFMTYMEKQGEAAS